MFQGLNKNVWITETLNWLFLVTVVAMLSLLFSRIAEGGMPQADLPPGTLPPINAAPLQPITDPVPSPTPPIRNDLEMVSDLWKTIELHRSGATEEAITGWRQMTLPNKTEIWRQVALAAAHLRLGQTGEAGELIEWMEQNQPGNALVHYYKGILLLTEAKNAPEWYDAVETKTRFVSYTPNRATSVSSLYQLAAIHELEEAIELAGGVNGQQRLLPLVMFASLRTVEPVGTGTVFVSAVQAPPIRPLYDTPMPLTPPTVGDLLTAIGADNFAGKAHNMLGPLYLERGSLQQAEEHMDAAVDAGLNVLNGYEDLAEGYESRGQHTDAFRANLKDMAHGGGLIQPGRNAFDSLRKWLED